MMRANRAATASTLAGVLVLGGCTAVSVDPGAGFPDVAGLVKKRSGREIHRSTDVAKEPTAEEAARDLLADGLDAEDAVRIALLRNRELQALYSDLDVAQSDLVQASLLHNPIGEAAAGFPIEGGPVDLSFSLAVDVIDLFYVPLRKRVAGAELEETKLRVAGGVLDLVGQTERAFLRHQANEQMLGLRRQVAETTALSLELARRMREAGNVTALELATERTLADEARLELRRAEIASRESREALNRVLGLWGDDTAWEIEPIRLPDPPEEDEHLPTADVERLAVERSLDLAMAERRVVAAGEQLGLNRASALFPEVVLGSEGERDGTEWDAGPTLAIPLPFFDRGQARIARARAELRRARDIRHAVAVRVRSAARETRDRMIGHRESAIFYRRTLLPGREQVVRETRLQLNAMQLAPFDLLRAKERQIEAGVGYVETLHAFWRARADLELILAGRTPPMEPALPDTAIESPRRSPIPTLN